MAGDDQDIIDTIAAHNCRTWQDDGHCDCGREFDSIGEWAAHMFDELHLKRESATDGIEPVDDPPPGKHRYVTGWMSGPKATVRIVEGSGYVHDRKGGIVLLGEWGRECRIECHRCDTVLQLRVCADEVLSDAECDERMDKYLRGRGWIPAFLPGDTCPGCAKEVDQ